MKWTSRNGRLSCIGCLLVLPWLFMLVLLAGCPQGGGNGNDNGNGNGNGNDNSGSGAGEIVTPASSFGLSLLDPPFQVRYNVPGDATNVQGYRFPVADSTLNSPSTGDPVVIASGLVAGDNQFFDFDPSEAGVGYYRVGVSFTLDGDADFAESSGVIQVQGPPDPIFVQPSGTLITVEEGSVVTVSFDCRDPENQVQWRAYYLDANDSATAPPDQVGTQLAVGSGNAGTVSFRTEGLQIGDYILGLSATDSGMSISATVAAGLLDRIVTIPSAGQTTPTVRVVSEGTSTLPTITITNPAGTDIELFKDETFTIEFVATVPQAGATGKIEVFYDTDANVNNGFTIIAEDLPDTATEVEFPTGVPEGEYYIGATIRDGVNAAVTDYSAGQVVVVRTVTISVTEPDSSLAVAPNTPVAIEWTTNAPDDAGKVDVFAQRLTSAGVPTGAIIPIITAGAMTLRTATFTSATTGLFQITVRLNLTEGTPVSGNAPRPVRVSTLPSVAWLGAIAEPEPRIDGAIFGGVNFEDNAGSAFAKADDLDGDGLTEFVIVARYGKPFFINPSGIGIGEAYVIYGARGANRLTGTYNLNSVGTSSLRGVVLTGIRTQDNFGVTEGMSDILSIPDADGDNKGELVLGFPKVFSRDIGYGRANNLSHEGQFLSGGVVILSSNNSILEDPDSGTAVINLDLVGQQFTDTAITPLDVEITLDDRFQFEPGDPSQDPPTDDSCVLGTDGVLDTVIGPNVGFVDYDYSPQSLAANCAANTPCPTPSSPRIGLAPSQAFGPLYEDGREPVAYFTPIYPDPPTEEQCPTAVDLTRNRCVIQGDFFNLNSGSGFYPPDADPLEPFGARIVGRELNDRFGATITFNEPSSPGADAELIFSAPERDATPGEIEGNPSTIDGAGIAYVTRNRHFWGEDELVPGPPPTPHQYIMNYSSHCSTDPDLRAEPIYFRPELAPGGFNNPSAGAIKIAGDAGDHIQNLLGIDDINRDGRNDLAIGAPSATNTETFVDNAGRVYIAYRRQAGSLGLEGDLMLGKLQYDPTDPERLDGLLITATTADRLGSSLAGGFDFNNDGISDLAIGSPAAGDGTGEVIILFGGTGIVSPSGGITVQNLLTQARTATGAPAAVRIRGATTGGEKGQFGFNIANIGDVDGDDLPDLAIAAPNASPRFDSDPNDGIDQLNTLGVDMDLNGVRDQVPGDDELRQAGLVYIIFGKNRLDQIRTCQGTTQLCSSAAQCAAGVPCTLTDPTINIDQLGTSRLSGFIIAGRRTGDFLGGGDAADPDLGGISGKTFGRGEGLGRAGDVDGDGLEDILIGALVADPRRDPNTGVGVKNGGEVYLIYGSNVP